MNELEHKLGNDFRRDLMIEAPYLKVLYEHPEQRAEFEKGICAQMMGLTLYPNGLIEATPNGLYLREQADARKMYEDAGKLSLNNPEAFEDNIKFGQALSNLMRDGNPGLSDPISIDYARVALGIMYQFERDGQLFDIVRFNSNPNDTFRNYAVPGSEMFKTPYSRNRPGDLVSASFDELIPCRMNQNQQIQPYYPYGNIELPGQYRRRYEQKSKEIRYEMIDQLAAAHNANSKIAPEYNYRPIMARAQSPIQFGMRNSNGSMDTLRGLIPYFTSYGSLELIIPTMIPEPDFVLDPEFKTPYAFIDHESHMSHSLECLKDPNSPDYFERFRKGADYPSLHNITLFSGADGTPMESGFNGYDAANHTMTDYRYSPCLTAALGNNGM